jgi:hypothetical protein
MKTNSKDYIDKSARQSRMGARMEELTILAAVVAGVAIGLWAASTEKVLGQESVVLLAMAVATVGLLALTLAAMTIVLGFLTDVFGELIEKLGLNAFFRPFKVVAVVSAGAGLVSFVGAIDSVSGSGDVRASLFGLATCLTVWAIVASVILVWKLATYAELARRAGKVGKQPG